LKGEIVHHKDFDKLNNEPDNLLCPISRQQHQKLPEYQARFIIESGLYEAFHQFWLEQQLVDLQNEQITIVEKKLVKEQNTRERLRGKQHEKDHY
jgi:Zn-dependent oligopeptidase